MLPKIQHPVFELTLPSSKKNIRYRPFLVKEEKMFLFAQESKSQTDVINTIKQVIVNCCLDTIDIENLPLIDFEYIFLKLRSKSVNNIIDVQVVDPDDGKTYTIKGIDLEKIEPVFDPMFNDKIEVDEKVGMKLKLPKFSTVLNASVNQSETQVTIDLLKSCIESVYTKDTVHSFSEASQEDQNEFIDSLPATAWEKVGEFFNRMPKLRYEAKYKAADGTEKTAVLEGVMNFFQ